MSKCWSNPLTCAFSKYTKTTRDSEKLRLIFSLWAGMGCKVKGSAPSLWGIAWHVTCLSDCGGDSIIWKTKPFHRDKKPNRLFRKKSALMQCHGSVYCGGENETRTENKLKREQLWQVWYAVYIDNYFITKMQKLKWL